MSNYNEQGVTGAEWQRAKRIVIVNPLGGTPEIRFDEETVLTTSAGQTIHNPHGYLNVAFDPDAVIDIYNPLTGEATGQTVTQGEVHALLYSAYLTAATARDAAANPIEPEGDE